MRFDSRNHRPADQNHRAEIDRLLSLESGTPVDVTIRLVGVPLGSILIYLYTDSLSAFVWSFGYVGSYFLYRLYLHSLGPQVTYAQQVFAHVLIFLLTISFLWLPSLMLVDTDRNQTLVGAALVGSQLMHLVHRGDTPLFLIFGVTATVFGMMLFLLFRVLPQTDDPIAVAGILSSWAALVFYLGQSMLAARARILAENAAKLQASQAQKLSALGQLAGGIAHDFNNILTAISGNLELYKELEDQAEKDEVIDAAQTASQRAAKIVKQILIYARKSPMEIRPVDANVPLSSVALLTEHLVPSRIRLMLSGLTEEHIIRIDPDQLITALMNLILNATDAIDGNGAITISVATVTHPSEAKVVGSRTLPKGNYVVYQVTDNGGGIPDPILKSVADPFFTTKPVGQGTGLGLSMAVSIADSLEGGLEIETSTNGTAVRIFVPCLN